MKLLRKIKAKLLRTFVTGCPKCHRHFYGNEGHKHQVKIKQIHYRYVCGKCAKEHKEV